MSREWKNDFLIEHDSSEHLGQHSYLSPINLDKNILVWVKFDMGAVIYYRRKVFKLHKRRTVWPAHNSPLWVRIMMRDTIWDSSLSPFFQSLVAVISSQDRSTWINQNYFLTIFYCLSFFKKQCCFVSMPNFLHSATVFVQEAIS